METSKKFHLHSRKGIFYVQFINPKTHKRLTAKSTGRSTRDEAILVVYDWLEHGISQAQPDNSATQKPIADLLTNAQLLSGLKEANLSAQDVVKIEKILQEKGLVSLIVRKNMQAAELLEDYLLRFWDYDRSPYVAEKLSHKIAIGKTYCMHSGQSLKRYWIPHFRGKTLGEISLEDIKEFSTKIAKDNPDLSPLSLKRIMLTGVKALRYAYVNGYISADPTRALMGYSSKSKKPGVLTPEEAMALFQLPWGDNKAILANLTAMTTGLRVGEILGLKMEDIGDEHLFIEHSFSQIDGLKSTKTEEPRTVPILPQIRDALIKLGQQNPHGNGYVFYCEKPDQPWYPQGPLLQLKKMLVRLRMGDAVNETDLAKRQEAKQEAIAYWKKRNVHFHSWRHFYSARMADRLDARKVMLATGHKTEAVFKSYADHALSQQLQEVAVVADELFQPILPSDEGKIREQVQEQRFEREKLHREVWAEPMTEVAKRYGVSDVAIGKACMRLNIPRPPRGYWIGKPGITPQIPELPENTKK
jgi:integrase